MILNGGVFLNQFNIVQEGQHRCCILLKYYGADYIIKVVKLYYVHIPRISFYYRWLKAYLKNEIKRRRYRR